MLTENRLALIANKKLEPLLELANKNGLRGFSAKFLEKLFLRLKSKVKEEYDKKFKAELPPAFFSGSLRVHPTDMEQ